MLSKRRRQKYDVFFLPHNLCLYISIVSKSNGVNKFPSEVDDCVSFFTKVWRFSLLKSATSSLRRFASSKILTISVNDGRSAGSCFSISELNLVVVAVD